MTVDLSQQEQVCTLRRQGLTFAKIAELTGVGVMTAHKYITRLMPEENKIISKINKPQATEEQQIEMATQYKNGFSQREIAKLHGFTKQVVRTVLEKYNIVPRKNSRPRQYQIDETFFDKIDTEKKAYWLGFIAADGNVDKRLQAFSICVHKDDILHLVKFRESIQSEHPIKLSTQNNMAFIYIGSAKLAHALVSLGITPAKSYTLKPCTKIPPNLMRHYWRGVLDGDGSITDRPAIVQIGYTGSEHMVNGFRDFITSFVQTKSQPHKSYGVFAINYGGTGLPKTILKVLYSNSEIALDRKLILANKIETKPEQRKMTKVIEDGLLRALGE